MRGEPLLPRSNAEFSDFLSKVGSVIDLTRRLPNLPFRAASGGVDACQYDVVLSGKFAEVLCALCDVHGDEAITLVTLEPDPLDHYYGNYGHYPGFCMGREALPNGYWPQMSYMSPGDPLGLGAIVYTANVVALVGSTGTWSVWGERDWDMALVHSQARRRPWLEGEVPFVSPAEALSSFTQSPGSRPLADSQRAIFLGGLEEMARGQSG